MASQTVRIGCVKYLNTLPLVEGLSAWRDAHVVSAVPSSLAGMLERGEIDVALCSIVDAVASTPLTILPVGMIGCDGPTRTVRVFSRIPFDQVLRLWADTDSHTSVVLARIILKRCFDREVKVVEFDARQHTPLHGAEQSSIKARWPETVLLIGDKVETDPPCADEGFVHELDLGRAWKDLTGLPFVYAAWMCRAGEEESVGVRSAAEVLERNRLHNQTRLDHLVCASATGRGWSIEHAGEYLGGLLRYQIGPREREAVERFLSLAYEMGLVQRRHVRWAEV